MLLFFSTYLTLALARTRRGAVVGEERIGSAVQRVTPYTFGHAHAGLPGLPAFVIFSCF